MSTALYPGSFDPITFGHLDVIRRAATVFERVVVAVLRNPRKAPLFDEQERIETIGEAIAEECPDIADRIEIAAFDGLTVDFARDRHGLLHDRARAQLPELHPGQGDRPARR